jgi:hypothetical protein
MLINKKIKILALSTFARTTLGRSGPFLFIFYYIKSIKAFFCEKLIS